MPQTRRKLLILQGVDLPVDELREALGPDYELIESPTISDGDITAIVSSPDAVAPESVASLILAHSPDAVCLADLSGERRWANTRFEALPPDVLATIRARCVRLGEEPSRSRTTRELRAHDGTFYRVSIIRSRATPGDGGSGEDQLVVLVRDISDERRMENRLETIDRAGEDLLRLDADQIRGLNAIERLRLVEDKIVRSTRDLLHFDNFTIRLIDQSTNRLETVISCGIPDAVADLELFPEETGSGVSGWVAKTGKSYICRNTESDPLFLPGMEGASSSLTVPLILHDRVIGIMDIESTKPDAFSEQDRRFAEAFARHIARTLHILNLLVVERSSTSQSACDRVQGELREPLDDILAQAEAMIAEQSARDPQALAHLSRIKQDVEAVRARVREVASGPRTLLGVERALQHRGPEPGLLGKHVLIADDEQKIRRILGDVLRHRGCTVTICASGSEAVEKVESLERLDLLISDIKMPDRNGYEIFHAARARFAGVPVILMTGFGYDPHHSIVRASEEGLQAVLFKPFQIDRMLEEVRKAVGAPPPDA